MVYRRFNISTVIREMIVYILLIAGGIVMLFPFLWMVLTSLKVEKELFTTIIPHQLSLQPYVYILTSPGMHFWLQFFNSITITGIAVFVNVSTGALAGYVVARKSFLGKNIVFYMMLSVFMVPVQILVIPLYFIVNSLHLLNTRLGVGLALSASPFSFFILYRFFREVPQELEDAARIDGASEFTIFSKIMIPLARSSINCALLISFIFTWSTFIVPFILLSKDTLYTLPVALYNFMTVVRASWLNLFAMSTLIALPVIIVFTFTQRQVFKGMLSGSFR